VIGFIGGMDVPPVEKFEAGFIAGAKFGEPGRSGHQLVRWQLRRPGEGQGTRPVAIDQGADVVFAAAGG
jgi:basic membrane protein A and related proteins